METDVILCSVTMKDLNNYFRSREGGSHNRRFAEQLAREVTKNAGKSKELLPTGWHEILHPPKDGFIRRLGFDLYADSRGGGKQVSKASPEERSEAYTPEKNNGPGTIAAKQCSEAV